jgi:hypothetical protein
MDTEDDNKADNKADPDRFVPETETVRFEKGVDRNKQRKYMAKQRRK